MKILRKALLCSLMAAALPALAATTAFVNATIYTADKAGVIRNGTLVMRDSRIVSVSSGGSAPPGATVIDATGKTLTPGMFAPLSSLGVSEIDGVGETNDSGSGHRRYSASVDMADAFNPLSLRIPIARVDGVTRAMVSPAARRGGSVMVGQGAVVSLGSDTDWMVKPKAAMFAEMGEGGASLSGTRATAAQAIREAFEEVKNARGPVRREPNLDSLLSAADIAALRPVLAGRIPLVVGADRASDIVAAIKLAKEYKLRLVISGGSEAWLVAKQLAASKVSVILDPQLQLPSSFESMGARADNARLLHEAGVTVAFSSDKTASYNARILRQLSGIAINSGLDPQVALAAITLHPARVYGVDKDLGSLSAGKLADVVMWDGDPFELASHPEAVFISGARMETATRQSALRDKYMRMHRLK